MAVNTSIVAGMQVETMYGRGTVVSQHPTTDSVLVDLAWGGDDFDAKTTLLSSEMKVVNSTTTTPTTKTKTTKATKATTRLPRWSKQSPSAAEVVTGAIVETMYGEGTIKSYDVASGVVLVVLTCYEDEGLTVKATMLVGDVTVLKQPTSNDESKYDESKYPTKCKSKQGGRCGKKSRARCSVM